MWNLFTYFFKCRHLVWLPVLCVALAGCKDDFDDSELRDQIADLDGRLTSLEKLCAQMNTNISSMQTIVSALQQNDYITGVTPITEGGNTIGYTITFMKNRPITIYHGKDGKKGEDGITPRFKIENGRWMVSRDNGSTWEDAGQATGDQGLPGVAGITPKLKIESGRWLISWDNGASWEDVGQATGDQGQQGAAGITPQFKIELGNWFVSFDHGTNWSLLGQATGDKGEDGITPVIGIRQDTDGIYYWTLNGTWLLDNNNQKVKAEGTDGESGEAGEEGKPGQNGITPLLKIEGGYWYVSYDNENSWKQLGKATGESEGNFFQEITEDDDYVYITLTGNQTTISIPKYKPLSIQFDISKDICASPHTTYIIGYKLIGSDKNTIIKAIAQDGYRALINTIDYSQGKIEITTPNDIVDSEVLVLISNDKGNTVIRSINFINGIISITTKNYSVGYEGGIVDVELTTNIEYIINIPDEAKSWLSLAPTSRSSMRDEVISFVVQPNENVEERSATILLQDQYRMYSESILITQQSKSMNDVFHVSVPGTLSQLIPVESINLIEEITITGSLNKTDYDFLNTLPILKRVDLSGLTDVTIPSNAFYNSVIENPTISTVILPLNLIEISDYAFYKSSIISIDIPLTVKRIGAHAFDNSKITSLIIPNSVEYIGEYVFANTENLHENFSIILPSNLIEIPDYAFYKSSIISIDIPPTVKIIGAHAFDNSKITSLIIPNSIEHIENNAFASTYNLRGNIIIPNTTTFIGECAFQHSNFDGTLTLGSGIKEIGPSAFQACHNVKGDLIIPANIQRIGKNAFSYCGSLYKKTLQINAELDTIPTGAFANANLTGSLIIPQNVVYIGSLAFSDNDFSGDLIIPNKVKIIGSGAFAKNNNATSRYNNLILGESITYIGELAFSIYNSQFNIFVGLSFNKVQIKITNPNSLSCRDAFGFSTATKQNFEVPLGTSSIYQKLFNGHINSIVEVEF